MSEYQGYRVARLGAVGDQLDRIRVDLIDAANRRAELPPHLATSLLSRSWPSIEHGSLVCHGAQSGRLAAVHGSPWQYLAWKDNGYQPCMRAATYAEIVAEATRPVVRRRPEGA